MLDETRVREIVKEDFPLARHALWTAAAAVIGTALGAALVQIVTKFCHL